MYRNYAAPHGMVTGEWEFERTGKEAVLTEWRCYHKIVPDGTRKRKITSVSMAVVLVETQQSLYQSHFQQ
jgi:hypothetical protein